MGAITFRADGRIVCVLCDSRHKIPGTAKREYNSYCGSYQYNGKQLITSVDATADPALAGTDQIRDISFNGVVLILKPTKGNGPISDGQLIIRWKKPRLKRVQLKVPNKYSVRYQAGRARERRLRSVLLVKFCAPLVSHLPL